MSKLEDIKTAIEKLPPEDFFELLAWIDGKRRKLNARGHGAFQSSYAPGDEGLYDDFALH